MDLNIYYPSPLRDGYLANLLTRKDFPFSAFICAKRATSMFYPLSTQDTNPNHDKDVRNLNFALRKISMAARSLTEAKFEYFPWFELDRRP